MLRAIVALVSCVVCAIVSAAQTTTTLSVSATVSAGCGVIANPVAFGSYPGTATSPIVDALGSIVVTCPVGNNYDVRLDNGTNASGGQRRMLITIGPAAYLNYELYQDSARTQRFGNSNFERVTGVGSGAPQAVPVYARLPGAQVVPLGAYLDTIQVTLQF
jgi:spore coat protein U-like protein